MCISCRVCAEIKPYFYCPPKGTLIKMSRLLEQLSINFKGPVLSVTHNMYLLVVIDKYSWFPFVVPCPNIHMTSIIKSLDVLFSLVRMPGYMHSNRGMSFVSKEQRNYLSQKGVTRSKTTPYHPTWNAFNSVICKVICLNVRLCNIPEKYWEFCIPMLLITVKPIHMWTKLSSSTVI